MSVSIREICKQRGLTYKELGNILGYSESAINGCARSQTLSPSMRRAIELWLENERLKQDLQDFYTLKRILST